jgi:homogentisate phytyltransferase / homogentisate geranylgeranyltransferase
MAKPSISQKATHDAPSKVSSLQQRPLRLFKTPFLWLNALWRFSRPHTIIGTSLSVLALFAIALTALPFASFNAAPNAVSDALDWPTALDTWLLAWIACLCGNLYIVGLNQLEDVAIDRINKPTLPLASGEFTQAQGRWLVGLAGAIALALAVISQNLFLILTIGLSLAIGTAYSLPPVRLKRHPFWASVCILGVRGVIVNLGLYLYFSTAFGLGAVVPVRVWALMLFVLVFSFAIAIFKDIPDLEGDRQFNISTYTLQLGRKKVFSLARWVLSACYGGLIVAAPFLPGVQPALLMVAHGLCIAYFWWLSRRVDLDPSPVQKSISYPDFYQFIWKLFFVEYLIFPLACWLANP